MVKNENREIKSSAFAAIFNEIEAMCELVNALDETLCVTLEEIQINTIEKNFFNPRENDVSCLITKALESDSQTNEGEPNSKADKENKQELPKRFLVLIEHQSTINYNMPFRLGDYFYGLQNALQTSRDRHTTVRFNYPMGRFFVFYNGPKPYPEYSEMKFNFA